MSELTNQLAKQTVNTLLGIRKRLACSKARRCEGGLGKYWKVWRYWIRSEVPALPIPKHPDQVASIIRCIIWHELPLT